MRYENFNFTSSFYNASGDAKAGMVANEMGKLIAEEPKAVVVAINNAGIGLNLHSSRASILKTIQQNRGNRRMIENLSALIILHGQHLNFLKKIGGWFKKKPAGAGGSSGGGGGFFKKIGGFFKKDSTTGKSKFGNWFRGNKKDLGAVGGALLQNLGGGSKGGGNQGGGGVEGAGQYYGGNQGGGNQGGGQPPAKKPMSMGVKLAIGGGVLVVIGIVIMVMRKK